MRRLGGAGGNADLPARADRDRQRTGDAGSVHSRRWCLLCYQPPEPDRDQGRAAWCARAKGRGGDGVRLAQSARRGGGDHSERRARHLYRRLCRYGLRDRGQRLRHRRHLGTMAHSWVQMYPDEYSAFKKYAEIYPDNCALLVDTYNVLKSGVPAAIKVFKEMKPARMGIRIDSGDVAYLTKQSAQDAGRGGARRSAQIVVSNSLDEYIIRDVILEGALDRLLSASGERLITAKSEPVFGGVYKLAAARDRTAVLTPKIKDFRKRRERSPIRGSRGCQRLYEQGDRQGAAAT